MSKKTFKSQASSSRAVSGAFGSQNGIASSNFGNTTTFGAVASSPLSYVYEPPDLSGLSEPNIVVVFKNVQKKDGTTKAKALEDLQNYISSLTSNNGELEEAVLEAWIKVYPRTSIDISRRVRQLAHTLQGLIALSCGKRIVKHMPAVVAPWLAGQYDNDKSVRRSACEAFTQVFATDEKRDNVWRLYQSSIVDFAKDVLVKETAYTLSDERTVSPDDAFAKYSRVVGAAITIVREVLENISAADLRKSEDSVDDFLNEEKLWKLSSHEDPFVRRALYRLLAIALAKKKDSLNSSLISASILTSGLHTSQAGSALDFGRALDDLSTRLPEVWTQSYTGSGKKSAHNRLCQFLKKGSQGGPSEFWTYISNILSKLPPAVLSGAAEDDHTAESSGNLRTYSSVLHALHEGINNKDEARINQGAGWATYLDATKLIEPHLPQDIRNSFYGIVVFPTVIQYIRPSQENSRWSIGGSRQEHMIIRACENIVMGDPEAFRDNWLALSAKLIEDLKLSLPEQAKEYKKSQESISAATDRWYRLQAYLMDGSKSGTFMPIIKSSIASELEATVSILKGRNGKPYGGAAALEALVQHLPEIVVGNESMREILLDFANSVIPDLVLSPSSEYLIRILDHLGGRMDVRPSYQECLQRLANGPDSPEKITALRTLVQSPCLASFDDLSAIVISSVQQGLTNDEAPRWSLVMAALGNPKAPKELTDNVLVNMTENLSLDEKKCTGLNGLEAVAEQNDVLLRDFASSKDGSGLLSKLLLLVEGADELVSQRAKNLTSLIQGTLATGSGIGRVTGSIIEIIKGGLDRAEVTSLSTDALVAQARNLLKQTDPHVLPEVIGQVLPNSAQWTAAFEPFLAIWPNASLAITNYFSGSLALIAKSPSTLDIRKIHRDRDGYSSAFRMVQYATKLINSPEIFESATEEQKSSFCKHIAIFLLLAGDNISISGSVPLWDTIDPDSDLEPGILDFIAETQSLMASWLQIREPLTSDFIAQAQAQLLDDSSGLEARAYYNGRAYTVMALYIAEVRGPPPGSHTDGQIKSIRGSRDAFTSAALLISAPDSKELLRLFNELLAGLTGHDFGRNLNEGLRQLVLMKCILCEKEAYVHEIPQQRLVFFVKHAVLQLQQNVQALSITGGQLLDILALLLPRLSDIYGTFWGELLAVIQSIGLEALSDENMFGLYATLRLLSLLSKDHMQASNDDLLDAWVERKRAITGTLVQLLTQLADTPDESHQPRRTINELLSRQLSNLSPEVDVQDVAIFPVLASESAALQQAAYGLLHTHLAEAQEQVSMDKALSKNFVATLPEELLSLILAAPSTDLLIDHDFERTMATPLRTYLLSWQLVFDHWQNASHRVQADYVSCLQEGTYVAELLNFALTILINGSSKPVDASKFNIETYTPGQEDSPTKEAHRLLIHLYYLCLRYLPSISKEWWRDKASRQLNIATKAWTEKHISPLIIAKELSAISDWAPSQATADQPLTVKVSLSAHEISASIPIDEQTMSIAVRLPPSYPLARAEVVSIHRVGVPEKKWLSWIMITQGIISIASSSSSSSSSNNSNDSGGGGGGGGGDGSSLIIDGLLAWRRNVTAALKGQAECAICYSVVSSGRELPAKKCQTCKNAFHSSCLFRWFKSSNSSSCPLCRNSFHYS